MMPGQILLIRADAGVQMGTGHVMRCLALAQAWQDAGGLAVFLSAPLPPALEARLRAEGMATVTVTSWVGGAADAQETARHARSVGAAWVVLDGYQFDAAYQKALKDAGPRLLVLDDNGEAGAYHADLVLNQNVHARPEWYANRAPDTRLRLGTRYALLRREFLAQSDRQRETPETAYKVLVTLGGSDPDNVTLKVLEALTLVSSNRLEATVVLGGGNPHRAGLEDAASRAAFPIRVIVNALNMPELMADADLAVSAAGSACWELAFLGVPALLLVTADNQRGIAQGLHEAGVAESRGWARDATPTALAEALTRLAQDAPRRVEMSHRARALVDGRGAARVLEAMQERPLRLRRAVFDDCRMVWEWVNDPAVRASAFSSQPIEWEDHQRWFLGKLQDPECFFFIALNDQEKPIGQIRFDLATLETGAREAETDVSIDSGRRGQGLGTALIRQGVAELARLASPLAIHARVKAANAGSRGAFTAAGFRETGVTTVGGHPAVSFRYVSGNDSD